MNYLKRSQIWKPPRKNGTIYEDLHMGRTVDEKIEQERKNDILVSHLKLRLIELNNIIREETARIQWHL